jgi:hypothetical protein
LEEAIVAKKKPNKDQSLLSIPEILYDERFLESHTGGFILGAGKHQEPGSFWSGLIDDVQIYNRAVTP